MAEAVLRSVDFFVPGVPRPKGSMRSVVHPKTGKVITMHSSKTTVTWQAAVCMAAAQHWQGAPSERAVSLILALTFQRPKTHYGTGRNSGRLKDSAPKYMLSEPDADKCQRAVFDALTSVVYRDDKQVVHVSATKMYGENPGVHVTISEW